MLKIWGRRNSINVQKVMWAVGELGLAHERIDAGGAFGGLDTEEFGALNPNRRVPAIDDDGTVVWESHAIVRYLCAKYGDGTLWPSEPAARAQRHPVPPARAPSGDHALSRGRCPDLRRHPGRSAALSLFRT